MWTIAGWNREVIAALRNNGTAIDAEGTSYECFGTWGKLKKGERGLAAMPEPSNGLGKPSASDVFLITDGDDDVGAGDENNWPDKMDNHGKDGQNFVFADGHARWVKAQHDFCYVWNKCQGSSSKVPH